jgi:enterochelin esterase family protein
MNHQIPGRMLNAGSGEAEIEAFLRENQFPLVDGTRVTFVCRQAADRVSLRHWIYGLPSSIPLIPLGETGVWYRTMEFPKGSRVEYKFGVARGGIEEWIHDPLNPHIAPDPFGGNSVVRTADCEIPAWTLPNPETPAGRLEDLTIESQALRGKRTARVYLPAGFRTWRRYRLLVVHDGDDYLRYSRMATVLDNLIDSMEIPPLVVAFSNPGQRLIEYANDPRHARHIVNELVPALESRYPLITESTGRCLMGASFGAVAALATAWRFPGVFDSLLLQSGSFAFTDIGDHTRSPVFDRVVRFMNRVRRQPRTLPGKIFVSCGVFESLIYENRSLVPFLQGRGVEVRYVEAYDGHNWENWRDRLRDGLTWLFPGPYWVTYL